MYTTLHSPQSWSGKHLWVKCRSSTSPSTTHHSHTTHTSLSRSPPPTLSSSPPHHHLYHAPASMTLTPSRGDLSHCSSLGRDQEQGEDQQQEWWVYRLPSPSTLSFGFVVNFVTYFLLFLTCSRKKYICKTCLHVFNVVIISSQFKGFYTIQIQF